MAATASPYGFRPVGLLGGRPFNQATRKIKIASGYGTNIFYGDPVLLVSSGTIEKDTGTATMTPVGIFLGCSYTDSTFGFLNRQYWPASTVASDAYGFVCDDPDAVFQIQCAGALAQTNIGNNCAIVQGSGSTVTGNSGITLNATPATTNTLPVKIIDFADVTKSGDAFADMLVIWNFGMHQYRTATGV